MSKFLLVAGIIFVLLAYLSVRYRRQILFLIRIVRMLKEGTARREQVPLEREQARGRLVKCASCGNWVPEASALRVPGSAPFCTPACVERAAEPG